MRFRTPLHTARGHGAAKDGVHHWWLQRMTALALIPLTFWFCYSLSCVSEFSYTEFTAWMQSPVNATLLIAVFIAGFYHGALGLQVVLEDYVSHVAWRTALIVVSKGLAFFAGLMGVVSVLIVAVGG